MMDAEIEKKLREILEETVAYYANGGDFKPEPAIKAIATLVVGTIPAKSERYGAFKLGRTEIGWDLCVDEMLSRWTNKEKK